MLRPLYAHKRSVSVENVHSFINEITILDCGLYLAQTVHTTKMFNNLKLKKMAHENIIAPTARVLLEDIRLSGNPDATTEDYPQGINGKINVSEDGRKYYIAVFTDPDNPLSNERYRMVSQTTDSAGKPVWKSGRPSKLKSFLGKTIPGDIVTREVEEYEVGENTVSIYSCVVLKGESISTVFRQQGHELMDSEEEYVDEINTVDAPEVEIQNAPEVTME